MGWKIVEVSSGEYLQLHFNNLLIKRENEKILINISDIDTLIVQNDRSNLSTKLLNALTNKNVNIILMNSSHEPQSYIMPVVGHHMSLKVFEKQLNWTNVFKNIAWQKIIKNKLFNQMQTMEKLRVIFPKTDFINLIENVKPADITNREGHGAKIYWHSLFSVKFARKRTNEINDEDIVINSMLNYGYAILRSSMIQSIIKKGLDSRISFFHKSFGNFFALASDLMEPFRPLVDEVVYANRTEPIFTYGIRDQLVGLLETKVWVGKNQFYLPNAMDQLVDSLVNETGPVWIELWG